MLVKPVVQRFGFNYKIDGESILNKNKFDIINLTESL